MRVTDWIGWLATAVFLASYSCKDQQRLRLTQAAAALLWVGYGMLLQAVPIVVANLLVAAGAAYSSLAPQQPPQAAASLIAEPEVQVRTSNEPD